MLSCYPSTCQNMSNLGGQAVLVAEVEVENEPHNNLSKDVRKSKMEALEGRSTCTRTSRGAESRAKPGVGEGASTLGVPVTPCRARRKKENIKHNMAQQARVTPYSWFRWQGVRAGPHPRRGGGQGGVTGKSRTTARKSLFSTGALLLYDQRVWVVLD
jgi:hypothetical protein